MFYVAEQNFEQKYLNKNDCKTVFIDLPLL